MEAGRGGAQERAQEGECGCLTGLGRRGSQGRGRVRGRRRQVPSNGTLRQVLESDCTASASAASTSASAASAASPASASTSAAVGDGGTCTGGVVRDIGAGLPYCDSDAFASLALRLAPDPPGGAGGQAIPVREREIPS